MTQPDPVADPAPDHDVRADASVASSTPVLLGWIEGQVHHLAASLDGLNDEQLRSTVLPSGWTPLGLLGHVRDSTCFWLENVVLGTPLDSFDEDAEWPTVPDMPPQQFIAESVDACVRACAAARGVAGDAEPGWWPEGAWGGYRQTTVLGVLVHLLADNAAHTGQLDVVRELIDGGVWDFSINGVRVPE